MAFSVLRRYFLIGLKRLSGAQNVLWTVSELLNDFKAFSEDY